MRLISLLFAGVLGTGCYATTSTGYTPAYVGPSVAVTATTVGPDLVYVSPGVQVIADYDEPIFYSDGFYWRETGGIWYRSSYHTHGWSTYAAPRHLYSIRDRHTYRHYRPAGWTSSRSYNARPSDRTYNARPSDRRYDARPAPQQRWDSRDNRWERDRRDVRQDVRAERRDDRAERRDVRQDNRAERRDTRQENRAERRDTSRENARERRENRNENRQERRRR